MAAVERIESATAIRDFTSHKLHAARRVAQTASCEVVPSFKLRVYTRSATTMMIARIIAAPKENAANATICTESLATCVDRSVSKWSCCSWVTSREVSESALCMGSPLVRVGDPQYREFMQRSHRAKKRAHRDELVDSAMGPS